MLYVYFYMRNIREFIINRIFALYITHRAVIQAGVCGFILHTPAYFFYGTRQDCIYEGWE